MSTLVSDAFTRADNASSLGTADSGQVWTAHAGTWGISSNRAVPPATLGTASVDAGATLVTVQLTGIPAGVGNTDVGLLARFVDTSNYLFLNVSKTGSVMQARMFKRVGGTNTGITTLVNPAAPDATNPFTMKVVFSSATAGEAFVNGASVGTFTGLDAVLQTPTRYGLWVNGSSGNARYDDLTITDGAPTAITGSDAGHGAEAPTSITVVTGRSDTGRGAESAASVAATITGTDRSAGTEGITALSATLAPFDVGRLAEAASVLASFTPTDTAPMRETARSITGTLVLADSIYWGEEALVSSSIDRGLVTAAVSRVGSITDATVTP